MAEHYAHLGESGGYVEDGRRLYAVGVVLSEGRREAHLDAAVRGLLLRNENHLHFREERLRRRAELARALAALPLSGGIVVHRGTANRRQEQARASILRYLLPRLQHEEAVDQAIVESRNTADQHDRRTVGELRKCRRISTAMHVDHVRKREDSRLWIADFLVSAYVAAELHDEREPWKILDDGLVLDVATVPGTEAPM